MYDGSIGADVDYDNLAAPRMQSEGIPVQKLEWYNKNKQQSIKEQFEVCKLCISNYFIFFLVCLFYMQLLIASS